MKRIELSEKEWLLIMTFIATGKSPRGTKKAIQKFLEQFIELTEYMVKRIGK